MPVVRAPPYAFFLIFVNHLHAVVHMCRHAIVHGLIDAKLIAVETVESIPCAEPYKAFPVLQDSHHGILAHAILDGIVLDDVVLMRSSRKTERKQTEKEEESSHIRIPFRLPVPDSVRMLFSFLFRAPRAVRC